MFCAGLRAEAEKIHKRDKILITKKERNKLKTERKVHPELNWSLQGIREISCRILFMPARKQKKDREKGKER